VILMTSHAVLIRAVNLGPHNKLPMTDLRELLHTLGLKDAQTLLQSGNAVFRSRLTSAVDLERRLERGAVQHLKLQTDFFVRTLPDLRAVVAANPFPREADKDPSHLLVLFRKDAPDRPGVSALQKAIVGGERVEVVGRQAYLIYPEGIGRSRLTTTLIEKKLGTRGTGRNWNTVLKLTALLEAL
jgi:uncharacterized protein (DUF1697 family)